MEHEFLSSMLKSYNIDLEFYTDGVGVRTVGDSLMWAWESTRFNIRYQRWWPGWNTTRRGVNPILPSHLPSPACMSLKKSFAVSSQRSSSQYDSGFFFFSVTDCSSPRAFICEAPLMDFGTDEFTKNLYGFFIFRF